MSAWIYHDEVAIGASTSQSLAALLPDAEGVGVGAAAFTVVNGAVASVWKLTAHTGLSIPAGQTREIGPLQWGRESDSMGIITTGVGGSATIFVFYRGHA